MIGPITIDIGRLKGKPDTWVVLDDHSFVYGEFANRAEAVEYARREASKLRQEGLRVEAHGVLSVVQ